MSKVGITVDTTWIEFGYSESLYSFFSTVCYCIEDKKWGSQFPLIMNELYYNEEIGIKYENIDAFENEIEYIKKIFSKLDSSNAIWSFEENILNIPSNISNINYKGKNLKDYYQEVFMLFESTIEYMYVFESNCKIELEPI